MPWCYEPHALTSFYTRSCGPTFEPAGGGKRMANMTKKYRSDAFAAIHETMEGLHEIGAIDKQTMREFDQACLTPVQVLAPDEIRAIRLH